jgi:hypothetical protein
VEIRSLQANGELRIRELIRSRSLEPTQSATQTGNERRDQFDEIN